MSILQLGMQILVGRRTVLQFLGLLLEDDLPALQSLDAGCAVQVAAASWLCELRRKAPSFDHLRHGALSGPGGG